MLIEPGTLVRDFTVAVTALRLDGWPCDLRTELMHAPHQQPKLPPGYGAVYAFALSSSTSSEAGAGMVLKVGKVGPNSEPRFRYQHYSPTSAGSTLAKSLLAHPIVWP